ncbi:MAG: MFS transporter [Candidatus Saccharimonadales bacterium]
MRKWTPLFVMGLAIIIIVLDTTLLNVSLGTIIRELNTNIQSLQWVIAAYSLTLAALTIVGGRFGDLFGRKKMFLVGAVIFAIGSFVASISNSVGMLIIGESIIEGIGAALMMPATASLLVSTYRGRDRAIALGVWGGMAAAGSAIGPVLGGYLTSHYSWRWGFRINIVVAGLLLLGSIVIKESRDREENPTIDWVGILLSSFGLLAGVFAIIESATFGWWNAKGIFTIMGHSISFGPLSVVPVAIAASIILLTAFYFWEQLVVKRGRTPLVNMKLFSNKQFTSGAVLTAILSIGQIGLIFGLPVFLQGVRGLDALHTGYALLPMSIALFVMAPLGGFIAHKFVPRHIVQVGVVINVIGLFLLHNAISVNATVNSLILPLLIYGAGMGLCYSQLSNISLSAVSVNEAGEASGVNSTLRQIGSSLGTAIIGSILIATLASSLGSGINNSNVISKENRTLVAKQVSAQSSAVEFGGKLHTSVPLTAEEQIEIKQISNSSTVKATRQALLSTVAFTILALLTTSQLPKSKHLDTSESMAATTRSR